MQGIRLDWPKASRLDWPSVLRAGSRGWRYLLGGGAPTGPQGKIIFFTNHNGPTKWEFTSKFNLKGLKFFQSVFIFVNHKELMIIFKTFYQNDFQLKNKGQNEIVDKSVGRPKNSTFYHRKFI